MDKKEELKVGERVTITLEAVEQDGCDGCFFGIGDICYNPTMNGLVDGFNCKSEDRSDGKSVIFKEVKVQKRKMKEDKYSLKIIRNSGDTTLDGYPIATYSNDELKILKNLITKVLDEVNQYIEVKE